MDLLIIVHIKSSYSEWKDLFDSDAEERSKFLNESKTLVAQANAATAIVTCFEVQMDKMGARMESPEFSELIAQHVVRHDIFTLEPLPQPA